MTDRESFDTYLMASETPFATGAARYWDVHPGIDESFPRVHVQFRPDGVGTETSFLALLDTGAHYGILNESVAGLIESHLTDCLGEIHLRTASGPIRGSLYAHGIELIAEVGENLHLDSTLFISPDWRAPSFLGYTGVLDRLRFAIDTRSNRFYFGSGY